MGPVIESVNGWETFYVDHFRKGWIPWGMAMLNRKLNKHAQLKYFPNLLYEM